MTIPVSHLIQVGISVAPNAIGTSGFGPLLFATPEFVPVAGEMPVKVYNSMKEVESEYPDGEIHKAASTYYAQVPKPKTFVLATIGVLDTPATPATLTGVLADMAVLNTVTAGTLSFELNGVSVTSTPVDLATAVDFAEVATLVDASLPEGVTLTQAAGVFTLTTTATGSTATLSFCEAGALADALHFTILDAVLVNGTDGGTMAKYLTDALNSGVFFYFVAIDRQFRENPEAVDAAVWCESNGKFYGYTSANPDMLLAGADSQAKELAQMGLMRTNINFAAKDTEYPEVSAMGRLATVNFNQARSTITLAYKDMPGVSVANINTSQLAALQSINSNVFMDAGGVGIYYDGRMADGTWADTVQGVDWLTNQIQTNVFNLFYQSTTKIPFTDTGVAMVNSAVNSALRLAVTNGLVGPGYDNEGNFYPTGYLVTSVPINDLQGSKGTRIWEGTSFIAIGTGALQGAVINGTFIQ